MTVACQKFVQSILELPATDEIHMEGRDRGSKGLARTKPGTYPTKGIYGRGSPIDLAECGIWHFFAVICGNTQNSQQSCAKKATSNDISSTRYKNVCRSDKRIAFSKLSYGIFEEKHTVTNMISVIRINILLLWSQNYVFENCFFF